jgi:hypothetical protein
MYYSLDKLMITRYDKKIVPSENSKILFIELRNVLI